MSLQLEDPRVVEFDVRTDEMLVNMGPQHPSTHGVLRLLSADRRRSRARGHAAHRLSAPLRRKDRRKPRVPAVDSVHRPHGLSGRDEHESRLSLAIEKLVKMEVPEKAMVLRVIIAELGRIASHLVGMGAYGLDLGTFSPFLYAFREREIILTCSKRSAARAHVQLPDHGRGHARFAGKNHHPARAWPRSTGKRPDLSCPGSTPRGSFSTGSTTRVSEYHTLLTHNQIFIKSDGRLGNSVAGNGHELRMHGPRAPRQRRSMDLRRDGDPDLHPHVHGYQFDIPFAPFAKAPPEVVLGDNWCRFYHADDGGGPAIRLCRQAIDRYPTARGNVSRPLQDEHQAPKDECISKRVSPRPDGLLYRRQRRGDAAPRPGQELLFLQPLGDRPICKDFLLGDIPAIVGSLDIVMGEIDR